MPVCHNIFSEVPEQLPEEVISSLIKNEQFQLQRIISKGHVTPPGQWYDQLWDEWVLLLQGQATILFEENMTLLSINPGDYLWIPARAKHRVEWTHPDIETFWLALHFKPSE